MNPVLESEGIGINLWLTHTHTIQYAYVGINPCMS